MTAGPEKQGSSNTSLLVGSALIVLGVLVFLGQVFRINVGHLLWPFFIIVPGLLLFVLSLVVAGSGAETAAILGGMVTGTGVLLFYQNLTGHWASWAYAWALVAPTSLGVGLLAYGALKGLPDRVRAGSRLAGIGLAIFAVGAIFFELVIGISGFGLGSYGWPMLLILLGVIWMARGIVRTRRD